MKKAAAVLLSVCALAYQAAGAEKLEKADLAVTRTIIEERGTPFLEENRGELVMRALSQAYPRLLGEAVFRDGDWALKLRGVWFYYADGRLLPENERAKQEEYAPQPFYPYPETLPAWKKPSRTEAERLIEAAARRQSGAGANRSLFFYDTLWNVRSRAEAWEQVKTIRFLGKSVLVHHGVLEALAMVEQKINAEARRSQRVKEWVGSLHTVSAWNWRNIADVKTRSNHAYGIALDLLPPPKVYRARETYWLWTAGKKNMQWWNVPYSKRYHPPEAVIKIFESYGFVWGGKWSFYDTMHFEYRPEILIFNNIPLSGEY